MVCSIQKEGRGEGLTLRNSRAKRLQQCGYYRWGGQYIDDWLVHRRVEVNEYLVKAKAHPFLRVLFSAARRRPGAKVVAAQNDHPRLPRESTKLQHLDYSCCCYEYYFYYHFFYYYFY